MSSGKKRATPTPEPPQLGTGAAARAALLSPTDSVTQRLDQRFDDRFVDRKRQSNLSELERAEMLAAYSLLPTDARGKKVGVAALESRYGRARGYISNTLLPKVALAAGTVVAGARPLAHTRECQAYKLTPAVVAWLAW